MNSETPGKTKLTHPYPGMRPFNNDESDIFFGRGKQIRAMIARLEAYRFLAVVGASGSGKSSLVKAGLIPSVEEGYIIGEEPTWTIFQMRPAGDPFGNLATSICNAAQDELGRNPSFTESTIRSSTDGIAEAFGAVLGSNDLPILLLVDQFEEIFRYSDSVEADRSVSNRHDAALFISRLLDATRSTTLPIYVVLTMRSEFIGPCDRFRGLPQAISNSQFLTPRLTRAQLQEAITGPAGLFGKKVDAEVVNTILNTVGDQSDQLPLMQHALMRAWDLHHDSGASPHTINIEAYKKSGGIENALSQHAEEAWHEASSEQKRIIGVMFRLLSERRPNKPLVRRISSIFEVSKIAAVGTKEVIDTVDLFIKNNRNFIVASPSGEITSESKLDISHEALLRQWQRIQPWLDQEGEDAAFYEALIDRSQKWAENKEAPQWLWGEITSPELRQAVQWIFPSESGKRKLNSNTQIVHYAWSFSKPNPRNIPWNGRYFKNEEEFNNSLRFIQKSTRKAITTPLSIGLVVLLSLLGLGLLSLKLTDQKDTLVESEKNLSDQKSRLEFTVKELEAADLQRALNQADDHLNHGSTLIEKEKEREGIDHLLRAYQTTNHEHSTIPDTVLSLISGISLPKDLTHLAQCEEVLFGPNGKLVFTRSDDGKGRLWNAETGAIIGSPMVLELRKETSNHSYRGILEESALEQGGFFSGPTAPSPVPIPFWGKPISIFSDSGDWLLTTTAEGRPLLWNTENAERHLESFWSDEEPIDDAFFLPGSESFVTIQTNHSTRIWDCISGKQIGSDLTTKKSQDSPSPLLEPNRTKSNSDSDEPIEIKIPNDFGDPIAFVKHDSTGETLVVCDEAGNFSFWNTKNGNRIGGSKSPAGATEEVALNSSGTHFLSVLYSGEIKMWRVPSGELAYSLPEGLESTNSDSTIEVAFSPSGDQFLTLSYQDDMSIKTWSTDSGKLLFDSRNQPFGHEFYFTKAQYSPDSSTIFAIDVEEFLHVISATTLEPIADSINQNSETLNFTTSRKNNRILTIDFLGFARAWDIITGKLISPQISIRNDRDLYSMSPDGSKLVSINGNGTPRIHNLEFGEKNQEMFHLKVKSLEQIPLTEQFKQLGKLKFLSQEDQDQTLDFLDRGNWPTKNILNTYLSILDDLNLFNRVNSLPSHEALKLKGLDKLVNSLFDPEYEESEHFKKFEQLTQSFTFYDPNHLDIRSVLSQLNKLTETDLDSLTSTLKQVDWKVLSEELGLRNILDQLHELKVRASISAKTPFVALNQQGTHIAIWQETGIIQIVNALTGVEEGIPLLHSREHQINSVTFSPSGDRILTASSDGIARIWDWTTGKQTNGEALHGNDTSIIAAFHPKEPYLVTIGSDKVAKVWNPSNMGASKHEFEFVTPVQFESMQFSPQGTHLVTIDNLGEAKIWKWSLESGPEFHTTISQSEDRDTTVYTANFNPAGNQLLTTGSDGTARIWDLRDGNSIGEALAHDSSSKVFAATYNKAGNLIATSGSNGIINRWCVRTGQKIGNPIRTTSEKIVHSVHFHPHSSELLLSCSTDGSVSLWRTPPPAWDYQEWLTTSVELATGLSFDKNTKATRKLQPDDITKRREILQSDVYNNETCEAPSWDQIHRWIEEKLPGYERMKTLLGPAVSLSPLSK